MQFGTTYPGLFRQSGPPEEALFRDAADGDERIDRWDRTTREPSHHPARGRFPRVDPVDDEQQRRALQPSRERGERAAG